METGDGLDRGALAGAVRSEERDDLSPGDGERHAFQCVDLAVVDVQITKLQH